MQTPLTPAGRTLDQRGHQCTVAEYLTLLWIMLFTGSRNLIFFYVSDVLSCPPTLSTILACKASFLLSYSSSCQCGHLCSLVTKTIRSDQRDTESLLGNSTSQTEESRERKPASFLYQNSLGFNKFQSLFLKSPFQCKGMPMGRADNLQQLTAKCGGLLCQSLSSML